MKLRIRKYITSSGMVYYFLDRKTWFFWFNILYDMDLDYIEYRKNQLLINPKNYLE